MARQVTQDAVTAFTAGRTGKFGGNTTVEVDQLGVYLKLHGNMIARRYNNRPVEICDGNWQTNTTKERLNGLPGVNVNQKRGEWFLNGVKWDGSWSKVSA